MILTLLTLAATLCQDGPISTALPPPQASAATAAPPPAPRVQAADFAGPLDDPRPPSNRYRPTPGESLRIVPPPAAAQAEPAPVDDRKMRCRQIDGGFICGNGGDNARQAEDLLRSLLSR